MNLGKLIKSVKKASRPEKRFKREFWRDLDSRFDNLYPAAPRLVPKRAVVIATAVLVILGIGSSAFAYESPRVIEGHPLYPVKQGIEHFEEKLNFTPEQKAKWHIKMQGRRLEEAQYYAEQNQDFRKKLFEKGMNEVGLGLDEVKKIEPQEKRWEMLRHLSEVEQKQTQMLQQIKPQLPQYSQGVIDRIIAEHTQGMQERVMALSTKEQEEFIPLMHRRFMIIRPPIEPTLGLSTSSNQILSADMIPWADESIEIRLVNY